MLESYVNTRQFIVYFLVCPWMGLNCVEVHSDRVPNGCGWLEG